MIHAFQKLGDPFCELIGTMHFHAFSRTKSCSCAVPVPNKTAEPSWTRAAWAAREAPLAKSHGHTATPSPGALVDTRSPTTGATKKNPILEPHSIPKVRQLKHGIHHNAIYTIPCVKIIVIVMSPNQTLRVRFTSPIVTCYSFYRFCWYLSMIEIHHPLSVFHSRDLHFKHIFTLCSHPCTGQISASSKTKQKKVKRSNHSFRCFF